jgi:transposase-like protein
MGRNLRGGNEKSIVLGMLETGGKVKARVIKDRHASTIAPIINSIVAKGATLMTDDFTAYTHLDEGYVHQVINHARRYVDGQIHTNGIENFWSLLKRGLHGTYVSTRPFHLFRYIDEQAFRYNNRKGMKDVDRFNLCVSQAVGRRLTYKEPPGKTKANSQTA